MGQLIKSDAGARAKGVGDNAVRNYQKWQEIRVNMDTIHENKPIDTSVELFGRTFKYPFFAGPVGAMTLHYGEKYDDLAYNNLLVDACAKGGIAAFTGDGTNAKVMEGATAAPKQLVVWASQQLSHGIWRRSGRKWSW